MNILVTGGAGYIGSHTITELIAKGHTVVVVDNLSNSSEEVITRLESIVNTTIPLYVFDLGDKGKLDKLFSTNNFDAVIHFAGLKAVGESVQLPLKYYRKNLDSTLTLLEIMNKHTVAKLVFSSSATVYGTAPVPYNESSPAGQGITSPYGRTKYMIEEIIKDTATAQPDSSFTVLRYFNPIGAHPSGLIGEDPMGIPNNLMPYITQVATRKRPFLQIFGNDYDTPDGTCIRDYIHVMDLARGHVAAIESDHHGFEVYNLGSGKGTSVLDLVRAFERVNSVHIPYEIAPRRQGDLPAFYADPTKALELLGWQTEKSIEDACRDSWRWQSQNSEGFNNS